MSVWSGVTWLHFKLVNQKAAFYCTQMTSQYKAVSCLLK